MGEGDKYRAHATRHPKGERRESEVHLRHPVRAPVIVFSRAALGEIAAGDLWVVNVDGSGLRQLTNLGPQKRAVQPCFSPDGKSVAFTLIGGKTGFIPPEQLLMLNVNMNVCAVDLAGGAIKQLTTDNGSAEPAWGL